MPALITLYIHTDAESGLTVIADNTSRVLAAGYDKFGSRRSRLGGRDSHSSENLAIELAINAFDAQKVGDEERFLIVYVNNDTYVHPPYAGIVHHPAYTAEDNNVTARFMCDVSESNAASLTSKNTDDAVEPEFERDLSYLIEWHAEPLDIELIAQETAPTHVFVNPVDDFSSKETQDDARVALVYARDRCLGVPATDAQINKIIALGIQLSRNPAIDWDIRVTNAKRLSRSFASAIISDYEEDIENANGKEAYDAETVFYVALPALLRLNREQNGGKKPHFGPSHTKQVAKEQGIPHDAVLDAIRHAEEYYQAEGVHIEHSKRSARNASEYWVVVVYGKRKFRKEYRFTTLEDAEKEKESLLAQLGMAD